MIWKKRVCSLPVSLLLSGAPVFAQSQEPRIVSFSPEGVVKGVVQVKSRFSTPMVPFGDPGERGRVFDIDCEAEGQARWIDPLNWSYDFDRPLPSGVRCRFELAQRVTDLEGRILQGPKIFEFSTGGPSIVESRPYAGSNQIDESQIFILELDGPVDTSSVETQVFFIVDGLASSLSVRLVEGGLREEILTSQYGLRDKPVERLLMLQPVQSFPASAKVSLVWSRAVKSPTGIQNTEDQALEFVTRPRFTAAFHCRRENAGSDCIPFLPMRVNFTAPVQFSRLADTRLTGPEGEHWAPESLENDFTTQLVFKGPFPKQTQFTLVLPTGIEDDAGRPLDNASEFPLQVATDAYPALAKFAAPFGIVESANPVLPVTVRNIEAELELSSLSIKGSSEISGSMIRVSPDTPEMMATWIRRVQDRSWEDRNQSVFESGIDPPETFVIPRTGGQESFEVVGIPLQAPGFYVVELRSELLGLSLLAGSEPMYVSTTALVTNLGVHLKWGLEDSLIWVTRLDEAEPVGGAALEVRDCQGTLLWQGNSDENGLARIAALPAPEEVQRCGWRPMESGVLVVARLGDDLGMVHSDWNEGIEPWRFRLPQEYDSSLLSVHTVLDRPLFRAGDTVHMKHLIRKRSGQGFLYPEAEALPARLVITHAGTQEEYAIDLTWDTAGVAESAWTIPREARLGSYQLILRTGEGRAWSSGSFRVEEFKVPLMRAAIVPPSRHLIRSTQADLSVSVEYLSGGGARRLPVVLRHRAVPGSWLRFPEFEGYTFANGRVEEGLFRRGQQDPSAGIPPYRRIALELDESGGSGAEIEVEGELDSYRDLVAELEFRDPNGQIQTVSNTIPIFPAATLAGIKLDGWMQKQEAIKAEFAVVSPDGKGIPGKEVRVELFQRRNLSHRKRLVGGFYAYEHVTETSLVGEACRGVTDDRGILPCQIESPVSGNLFLVGSVVDDQGNRCSAHTSLWVAGDAEWWFEAEDHDRIDLIPEKKDYQTGETARFQVRMPFRKATALVTVEREGILETFVIPVRGNESVIEVPVRRSYAPNVFVSALLVRGRVAGVEPTAIVDLGKPAYKLGIAELTVGREEHRLDVRVETDRKIYGIRQEAVATIKVSQPQSEMLPVGSEVSVAVVDEGLLELASNQSWEILEAMMGRRRYGLLTATAQMQVVGKRHFGLKALPSGGGGGKQLTRELFDTLLLWNGRVPLDEEGRAEVRFRLNDSVTSFRVVAVATAGADRFGTGSTSVRTSRDLALFSGLPPFVREGDRFDALLTLRNERSEAQNVELRTRIEELDQDWIEDLQLEAGSAREIRRTIEVPRGHPQLSFLFDAEGDRGSRDRLSVRLEVAPAVPTRTIQSTLDRLDRSIALPVERPRTALKGSGGVEVELSPSLVSGLAGVRDYMREYPYSCLEQELSRAVVLDNRTLWENWMGLLNPYTDENGLLRYFPGPGPGSEVLTAYVLSLGHQAGFPIPEAPLGRMLDGLNAFLEGRISGEGGRWADLGLRKLSVLEALSRHGRADPEHLRSLERLPNLWPTSAVLDWYGILFRMPGFPGRDQELLEIEQILRGRVNLQGASADLPGTDRDRVYWLLASPDGNLARFLILALERPAWLADLPRLARGLLSRQSKGHWDITPANAWGTLAVTGFASRFEAEAVSGTTSAVLSGEAMQWNWRDEPAGGSLLFQWPSGAANLRLEHSGRGAPWLVARARAAVPAVEVVSGYRIAKTVEPVEQRLPERWSVGDIVRVRLELEARSDMAWVVVSDPIPTGAMILGSGLGRDSRLLTDDEEDAGWARPTFEERSFQAYRAYFSFLNQGSRILEYTLRLNSSGAFSMPPTRVEAMYMPELFGESPNADFVVEP